MWACRPGPAPTLFFSKKNDSRGAANFFSCKRQKFGLGVMSGSASDGERKHVAYDRTLYDILGVDEMATTQTITAAYHRRALEHHPDKGGDHKTVPCSTRHGCR
jgi:hypothetical protein